MGDKTDGSAVTNRLTTGLGSEMAGRFGLIATHAPAAFEGYQSIRAQAFKPPEDGGAIPPRYRELIVIAIDAALDNPPGVAAHARQAVEAGATMEELAELITILLMTIG